jgi:hypothetical protein
MYNWQQATTKELAMFIDFQQLKAELSIERAVQLLGLTLPKKNGDQLRGPALSVRPAASERWRSI